MEIIYLFEYFAVCVNVSLASLLLSNIGRMKRILFITLLSITSEFIVAQTGDEAFTFLRYPTSARANALGGNVISLVESDPSLIFHNPALLGGEMDGMLNVNYMNYMSDVNVGDVVFTKALKERSAWGIGISYFNYGSFEGRTTENISTGTFSAQDLNLSGFFSYDLSDRWRGGTSFKFLYSHYDIYSSFGIAVDAGLSYYNSDKNLSYGIVLKNIGAQLKSYEDKRLKMPWDIQLGFSRKMNHAPIRFSMTAYYLNKWKLNYLDETGDEDYKEDSFTKTVFKHLIFGVDFVPSDNFWFGVGFNPKRSSDMKLQGGNSFSGFSAGAGIKIKSFDVGCSIAKFHPSAVSFLVSISRTFGETKL